MFRPLRKKEGAFPSGDVYREFADSLDVNIVLIDSNLTVRYLNAPAIRSWGEGAGKQCHEFLRNSRTPCDDCPIADVVKTAGAKRLEMRMPSLEGWHDHENLFFHVGETSSPVQFVALVSTNIDKRKHLEREVFREKELSRTLLLSVNTFAIGIDNRGEVIWANRAGERMSGYSREEITEGGLRMMTPGGSVHLLDEFLRSARAGEISGEPTLIPLKTKAGEERSISWTHAPLFGADGKQEGAICLGQDVTERVRSKGEVEERARELEVVNAILFMAGTSSEFEEMMEVALDALLALPDYRCGVAYTLEGGGAEAKRVAYGGFKSLEPPSSITGAERMFPATAIYERRVELATKDTEMHLHAKEVMEGENLKGVFAIPLIPAGHPLGVLLLGHDLDADKAWEGVEVLRGAMEALELGAENAFLRVRAEERAREATVLLETARSLSGAMNLEDALGRLVEEAAHLLRVDLCSVFLLDKESENLFARAGYGWDLTEMSEGAPLSMSGTAKEAALTLKPVEVYDAEKDPRVPRMLVEEYGVKSSLTVPLLIEGRFAGGLFFDVTTGKRKFSAHDLNLAETFARDAAISIHNADLVETLRESEERYRLIAENSMAGIFVHDGVSIHYINERGLEISGFPREHFKGMEDILGLVVPEEREKIVDYIRRRLGGEDVPRVYDTRIRRADGSVAEVQLMNTPMSLGGKPAIMVMVNDITDRARAEEALRVSEERFKAVIQSSQNVVLIVDLEGKIVFANEAAGRFAKVPHMELAGRALFDFVKPDGKGEALELFERSVSEKRGVEKKLFEALSEYGESFYFEATSAIIDEPGRETEIMIIANDVTGRELAMKRLEESESRYRTIVERTNELIVLSNRSGEITFANSAIKGMFGYEPDEVAGKHLFQFVDPEDRERVAGDFVKDWKTGKTIPNYQIRCVRSDGSAIYVEANSELVGWPGEDAFQVFVIRDVTERHRKEKEQELRLKVEEASATIASRFVDPGDVFEAIQETLEGAGELLNLDRAYYFEFSGDGSTMSSAVEWVSENGEPMREGMQEIPTAEFGWLMEMLGSHREVIYEDIQRIPGRAEREILMQQRAFAVAVIPVFVRNRLAGFIGFVDAAGRRTWSVHEIGLVRSIAETVSRALERKDWVEELGRSERFRASITESIDEGLVVLRNGVVTWANRQAAKIQGYEIEEMIGKPGEIFLPNREYAEEYVLRMLEGLHKEGRYVSEERSVRKDGQDIYVLLAVTPLGDPGDEYMELVAAVRDITESKRLQEEVAAAAEAYSTLFSTAGDALIVHTFDGRINDANERASVYTGYSRDELLEMSVVDLVEERSRTLYGERQRELEREGATVFETNLAMKTGGKMPVEVTARKTRIWGETVILSALRDVTGRKKAEREVVKRAGQLASLNEIVKASTSSLDLETAMRSALDVAIGVSEGDSGFVVLGKKPGAGAFSVVADKGHNDEFMDDESVRKRLEAILGAFRSSRDSIILNGEEDPGESRLAGVVEAMRAEGLSQELLIPLRSGEKVMGILEIGSSRGKVFKVADTDFFNAVGAEIGVSLENALIYGELSAEHERLSLLYRIAQNISAEIELEALLNIAAEEAATVTGAESVLIGLTEPGADSFVWGGAYNVDTSTMEELVMPVDSGIGGIVVGSKRSVSFRSGEDLVRMVTGDRVVSTLGVEKGVAVPLISGDRVVGVMGVHFRKDQPDLSAEDVVLLEALGRQAGVAIEKARLFEETREHLEHIEKAHEELMTLDRMKSDFVSTVSHELRSPLAVIEGFARTLVEHFEEIDRDTEIESIEIILKKSIALEGLIENILDMARIEEGRLEVSRESADIIEICRMVRDDQARVVDQHELVLDAEVPELMVMIDPDKTEVALGNLVRNAIKFSPEGGLVTIAVKKVEDMAEVSVTDEGIGIPAEEQERIFDRFYQADSGETRSYQGSGLGLYITKEVVEAMGGGMVVKSERGKGSTFAFTVPLA